MKSATHIIVAAGILSACSPTQVPEPQSQGDIVTEVAPTDLPGPVQSAVSEAMPDMTVLEVLRKERGQRVYFDVEGERADGSEIELDVLYADGVAEVVEIQRDLPWTAVPADVQAAPMAASSMNCSPTACQKTRPWKYSRKTGKWKCWLNVGRIKVGQAPCRINDTGYHGW